MAASPQDPIHLIAQATTGEIGTDFLAAPVRSMRRHPAVTQEVFAFTMMPSRLLLRLRAVG